MDHRITIAIVAVFGGTLAFTLLIVSLTAPTGPDGSQTVLGALVRSGDDDDAETQTGPSPRERLLSLLGTLNRRTEQWRREHGERVPDFQTYPSWEQFLEKTDPTGKPQPLAGGHAAPVRGSYLSEVPVNALNNLSTVVVVDGPVARSHRVPEAAGRVGFVYSIADRCYWGTNGSGRVVTLRSEQALVAPHRRRRRRPPRQQC